MIISSDGEPFKDSPYKLETELQNVIFQYPLLVRKDNEDNAIIVKKREVSIEGAADSGNGKIDCLFVGKNGDITIVETKLARNGESRRMVVGQIFDYVSALSEYNYDRLDKALNDELSIEVSKMSDADGNNFRRTIDRNLSEGNVRLVIALDEANSHLKRIVGFLSDNTDFELDLIEIKCYLDGKNRVYSSNIVLDSAKHEEKKEQKRNSLKNPVLDALQDEWNTTFRQYPPAIGENYTYRQIRYSDNGWPATLHYEFTKQRGAFVEVRLDNEIRHTSSLYDVVAKAMKKYIGKKLSCNGIEYEISSKSYSRTDKADDLLFLKVESDNVSRDACELMSMLIELTLKDIDKAVQEAR